MPLTYHAGAASGAHSLVVRPPDAPAASQVPLSASVEPSATGIVHRAAPRGEFASELSPAQLSLLTLLASPRGSLLVCSTNLDWAGATSLAARLGCLPRLAAVHLEAICGDAPAAVPEEIIAQWIEARHSTAARNLLLAHEEQALLDEFAAAEIPAMPLKGVSLARILHSDPAARAAIDIDFAIHPAHIAAAADILRARGYFVRLPAELLRHTRFVRSVAAKNAEATAVREHAGMELLVELHWKILPLPDEEVWRSLHHYEAAGVRALPPDLYFLFLCEHLAGHGWGGLRWLCDAGDFLLRFAGEMDAARILRTAAIAGLRRATGVTLELLDAYFGVTWSALDPLRDSAARRHAARFLQRPLQGEPAHGIAAHHREQLGLQDSFAPRMKYLWRLAHPTHVEWLDTRNGQLRIHSAPAAWARRAARLVGFSRAGGR